ncbi:hypothetical protein [Pendulispora albinea]|uniref:Uncharacterized protein n=1 Tax=Pendulispora albinea TaxID=2741071 RepID=A0ABZ2LYB8_9BACT
MRTYASLAVACGVHAAFLAVSWKQRPAQPALDGTERPAEPTEEWDLDVAALFEKSEVREEAPVAAPEPARKAAENAPREPMTTLGSVENAPQNTNPGAENPTPSPASSSSSAPAEGWTFSPTVRKPVDLGLGAPGGSKYVLPDGVVSKAELPADERPSTTGGLAEALDAEDVKRGTSRGQPVRLAVEAAARTTEAPSVGRATFDISVGAEGAVQIQLADANNDYEGWKRLVEAIRGQLARKRVRIPPGSKGLHVVVEVEARDQKPDGTPANASALRRFGANPDTPVGGSFSLSPENIGVSAKRFVSSRIVRETRL